MNKTMFCFMIENFFMFKKKATSCGHNNKQEEKQENS